MERRDFLRAVGVGAATLALPGCVKTSRRSIRKNKQPNIIYILADDLGYGDLGCYGQKRIKTPNLDKMAAEGMQFTQHYAGSTVCAPSRCCLMTGLHTGRARVRGNAFVPLEPGDITVAKVLKKAGYSTAIIGKWGLGEEASTGIPTRQGFDYFYGYLSQIHAHNYYPEYLWRNEQKVALRNKVEYKKTGYAKGVGGVSTNKLDYSHDFLTKEALTFVERSKNDTFFLYLAYTIPHANNEARKNGMEVPDYGIYKDKDWPDPQKGQAAMITRMDSDIGELFAKLKQLGLDDNTVVIFSSDNGPHKEGGVDPRFFQSSGPLRGRKQELYEGGIRVPMLARWPSKIKPGSFSDHVSAFWDILPTCADLANTKTPDSINGISLAPTLLGQNERQKQHEFLYWEYYKWGGAAFGQAVRMGDWKAVRLIKSGGFELYNLKNDPSEKNNLADRRPEVVEEMKKCMIAAHTYSPHWSLEDKK